LRLRDAAVAIQELGVCRVLFIISSHHFRQHEIHGRGAEQLQAIHPEAGDWEDVFGPAAPQEHSALRGKAGAAGRPLAVVEAKKSSRNPLAGERQAAD